MGKYDDYQTNDRNFNESPLNILIQALANEFAEKNRLKRFELFVKYGKDWLSVEEYDRLKTDMNLISLEDAAI